jgi:nucleoside-triphosphatase THEP1
MIRVILLSAPRGVGKTTACERFSARARQMGLRVGGILTPVRYDAQGLKVGIDAVDAYSGERRTFAVLEPDPDRATIGQYRMDEQVMSWALQRIRVALGAPIDAVVIDEIGPLELLKKGGFWPALEQLTQAEATAAVIIVRPQLLAKLQDLLEALQPTTVLLNLSNRDEIPARILGQIWGPTMRRAVES